MSGHHEPDPGAMLRVVLAPCSPFSVTADLMVASASLARELGVSRTPLREALIGLADRGLLVSAPGRGFLVPPFDPDEARRLYPLVAELEALALRWTSPLELAGRNIYIREGCYVCHSQMVRPFRDEVERYGHYSIAAESMYDHPFQWGSKRTGPDLARVGGKYSNEWHVAHLVDPRSVVPQSIMPDFPWLATTDLEYSDIQERMEALKEAGVPYTDTETFSMVPLGPHQSAPFRIILDQLTDNWNQNPPTLRIIHVSFQ